MCRKTLHNIWLLNDSKVCSILAKHSSSTIFFELFSFFKTNFDLSIRVNPRWDTLCLTFLISQVLSWLRIWCTINWFFSWCWRWESLIAVSILEDRRPYAETRSMSTLRDNAVDAVDAEESKHDDIVQHAECRAIIS
jgi:hypothetical protein